MNKLMNICDSDTYQPLSKSEIFAELTESRLSYKRGEGEEHGKVISGIGEKYDLKMQRDKYVQKNPLPMKEMEEEIQAYRKGLI